MATRVHPPPQLAPGDLAQTAALCVEQQRVARRWQLEARTVDIDEARRHPPRPQKLGGREQAIPLHFRARTRVGFDFHPFPPPDREDRHGGEQQPKEPGDEAQLHAALPARTRSSDDGAMSRPWPASSSSNTGAPMRRWA